MNRIDERVKVIIVIEDTELRLNRICPFDREQADCGNWCPHFFASEFTIYAEAGPPNIEARIYLACAPSSKSFSAEIEDHTCDDEEEENR